MVSDEEPFSDTSREAAAAEIAARSPSPSRRHHQHPAPSPWMSPGKAAANAATAAAKEAARAAAASVRAAEAAADAAEAAEAAAEAEEAEEEMCSRSPGGGGAFRSPPPVSEFRQRHSPARSAFRPTEGDKDGAAEHQRGTRTSPRPTVNPSTNRRAREEGSQSGDGETPREMGRHRGRGDGGGGEHKDYRSPAGSRCGGSTSEEEMLRKARDQVRGRARETSQRKKQELGLLPERKG